MYMRSDFLIQVFIGLVLLSCLSPRSGQITIPQRTHNVADPADSDEQNPKAQPELWFGVLKTPIRVFRFVIEFNKDGDESAGELRSLDEGSRTFPLTKVRRDDGKLSFTLPLTDAAYESSLNDQGTQAEGKWTQRGQQLPLSLRKVDSIPTRKVKNLYTGTLNAIVQKLDVAFIELESGEVYFDSVTQHAGGFLVTKQVKNSGAILFRVPGVQGVFEGQYSNRNKAQLHGKWTQGLVTLDLELSKQPNSSELPTPTASTKPQRPQTPKAPFPYTTEQVKIPTSNPSITLAGTLCLPAGKVHAAIVLVSGSGPQDRDETIFDHKPFLVIADHFARQGIATIRYDDRGVAQSTGDFSEATTLDLASDAEAVFEFLAARSELAETAVGICGHSEGGIIAPMIAARNTRVQFIILMAAPGVDGRQIILSQGPLLMRAQGLPEHQIAAQTKTQEIILTIIRDHEYPSKELIARQLQFALGDDTQDLAGTVKQTQSAIAEQASPWLRTFLKLDPKKALMELKCPVLAINGTKDLQVDPVLNLSTIRDTLQAAGNHDIEINVYPGLNHLFQACNTGLPAEYRTIEETFNLVPLERMSSWTLKQARKRSTPR